MQHGFLSRIDGAARTSSNSSDDVFSEESDSNALNSYDSNGDTSEPLGESGPSPYQYKPRRVHRTIRTKATQNRLTAIPSVSELTQTGI